jgi:uncharacterized membrane protein YphA (DoxX/SURF4 family)
MRSPDQAVDCHPFPLSVFYSAPGQNGFLGSVFYFALPGYPGPVIAEWLCRRGRGGYCPAETELRCSARRVVARPEDASVEISRSVVTMSTAGLFVLVAGIAARRRELRRGPAIERAIALGRVFVAAPLATFGGLHLAAANGLMQMVPAWMPWRLFWAYLVGFALIATALSLISGRLVRWAALLAGAMLLAFVATIHVPIVVANMHDRFAWAVLLRDTAFAAGLLALAGSRASTAASPAAGWARLVTPSRLAFAVVALFFAVEHFLHPEFAPAVPLERMTPWWAMAPRMWGYSVGAVLLGSGALLLVNRWAREAAAWLGIAVTVVVLVIYVPMLWPAHGTDQVVEAIDYVADTLLFAGTALILAEALGADVQGEGQASGIRLGSSD